MLAIAIGACGDTNDTTATEPTAADHAVMEKALTKEPSMEADVLMNVELLGYDETLDGPGARQVWNLRLRRLGLEDTGVTAKELLDFIIARADE